MSKDKEFPFGYTKDKKVIKLVERDMVTLQILQNY